MTTITTTTIHQLVGIDVVRGISCAKAMRIMDEAGLWLRERYIRRNCHQTFESAGSTYGFRFRSKLRCVVVLQVAERSCKVPLLNSTAQHSTVQVRSVGSTKWRKRYCWLCCVSLQHTPTVAMDVLVDIRQQSNRLVVLIQVTYVRQIGLSILQRPPLLPRCTTLSVERLFVTRC
jgi:hypothetical protein